MLCLTDLARRFRSEPRITVLREIAMEMLHFADSADYRDVTRFLVVHDHISDLVVNRSIVDRTTAAALVKIIMKHDATVAQTLLKRIVGTADAGNSASMTIELLSTLDEAGAGKYLGAALVQLLRTCDDKVRSKIAMVLGHNRFNTEWALRHRDRRVRANAVEAMWKIDSPGARRMLYQALLDGDNRVRGNAIYGLLLLNDRSQLAALQSMKNSTYAKDRATAAWVMGELKWPEFLTDIIALAGDKDMTVSRQATRALDRLTGPLPSGEASAGKANGVCP